MTKIKTIIFDLGGVYLTRGMWLFREKYLVKKFDVKDEDVVNVMIKKYYGPYFSGEISEKEYWTKVLKDLRINSNWKVLRKILLEYFEPNEKMPELVTELKKNYRIGLLSDQTKEWWPHLDKTYDIKNHFDFTIISSDTGFHKPQPEIYTIALKEAGCKPEECLYIDDLEDNLAPAKELGMHTIVYKDTSKLRKELVKMKII
jgi:epoxide hydrolase-like predicted phosphatase